MKFERGQAPRQGVTDAASVHDLEPGVDADVRLTAGGEGSLDATPATGRQAAWNYLVFALSKSSTLLMTVVVARMLTPAEFGLFALALLVMSLFDYVKDLGVGAALVQSRRDWRDIAPTGLIVSAGFGLLASAALAGSAGFVADLLGHAELGGPIRVLAVGLAISSLGAVPAAWVRRQMSFSSRLIPEFAGALGKTGVTIALAATGHGVWSLVYGQLVATVLTTLLYWLTARAPVGVAFDGAAARDLVRYGIPVTALTLLAFAIYNVDYLSIGTRAGATELGYYTLAYRLPELLVLNLCVVISEVLFSALSQLQHDRAELSRHYRQVLRIVVALTAPIGVGLAVAAGPVIGTMYGHSYASAHGMLSVLAIYTVIYSMSFHAGDVFKAVGRPGILTAINAGKLAVLAPLVWWAAGTSALLVAVTLLAVELAHCVVRFAIVREFTGLPWRNLLAAVAPPLVAAAPMAAAMWVLRLPVAGLADVLQAILLGAAGLLVYVIALRFTAPELVAAITRRIPRARSMRPVGRGLRRHE